MKSIDVCGTELAVKEWNDKRVVTFADIDAVHQRPEGTARKRFNDNKGHFILGEDYYVVKPKDLENSQMTSENITVNPRGTTFVTESGYLMLVKSFTDDLAWDVQRKFINQYFGIKKDNLELIKTETYNNTVPCDFYHNEKNDVYMTREQIGRALGYADPSNSIKKIHKRHRDRLDKFCIKEKVKTLKTQDSHEGGQAGSFKNSYEEMQTEDADSTNRSQNKHLQSEVVYYSERGIMEICRWSDMPKADDFFDWAYDIIEAYRHGEFISKKDYNLLLEQFNTFNEKLETLNKNLKDTKEELSDQLLITQSRLDTYDSGKIDLDKEKAEFIKDAIDKMQFLMPYCGYEGAKYGDMLTDIIRVIDKSSLPWNYWVEKFRKETGRNKIENRLQVIAEFEDLQCAFLDAYNWLCSRHNCPNDVNKILDEFEFLDVDWC